MSRSMMGSRPVEDSEAYRVSLLRFGGAERTIGDAARLLRAPTLPTKRRSAGFRVKFKTRVARRSNAFTIDFDLGDAAGCRTVSMP